MVVNATEISNAVFLDRDGIINRAIVVDGKPYAPRDLKDFHFYPAVQQEISRLRSYGFVIVVVTNQPDVGNRLVEKELVEKMHDRMEQELGIDCVKTCFHSQTENCDCRKPEPGMLLEAAQDLNLGLPDSFIIGDRKSDVEAGKAAGCKTIFVDRGYRPEEKTDTADITVLSLTEAVNFILKSIHTELKPGLKYETN